MTFKLITYVFSFGTPVRVTELIQIQELLDTRQNLFRFRSYQIQDITYSDSGVISYRT